MFYNHKRGVGLQAREVSNRSRVEASALPACELSRAGIDVPVICGSMTRDLAGDRAVDPG
jgi:hypothetical protein